MTGFSRFDSDDGPVEGIDLPRTLHILQGLEGAQIEPGREYLIWFSFEAAAPAVPTYVKIDLVPPPPPNGGAEPGGR